MRAALRAASRAVIDAKALPLVVPADLGVAARTLTYEGMGKGTVVPGTVRLFKCHRVPGAPSLSNDRLSVTFTPNPALDPSRINVDR